MDRKRRARRLRRFFFKLSPLSEEPIKSLFLGLWRDYVIEALSEISERPDSRTLMTFWSSCLDWSVVAMNMPAVRRLLPHFEPSAFSRRPFVVMMWSVWYLSENLREHVGAVIGQYKACDIEV